MDGFHGYYLKVDLGRGTMERVSIAPSVLLDFIGGVGLGAWLMLRESRDAYGALDPEAPLVFSFAPLVGTALNTSAKAAVLSKSPLTERLNDAMVSSQFALSGKGVGCDAIVITGACESWSTLFIEPEGHHLKATPELRGLSAQAAEAEIRRTWGEDWSVVAIGKAGENLVPFALMSHDGRHAGRGGTGAVMGAKGLKAIAVRGDRRAGTASAERFEAIRERLQQESLGHATEKYRTTGILGNLLVFDRLNILPTLNFRRGTHELARNLSAEQLFTENRVSRTTCADCMIGCEKRITGKDGASVRLEYENVFALGSLLDIWDAEVVLEASRLCDEYGLDTITTGGTLAFAMECVERGLWDEPGLRFSDGEVLLEAIPKIATREGYGARLALGSRALAGQIGKGSEAFAAQVKGLEMPGYHPGRLQTLGLGFAVGSRGADHNKSSAYDLDLSGKVDRFRLDVERVEEMVELEDQAAIVDSLILCKFVRRALTRFYPEVVEILTALTGEPFSEEMLRASARKIHHLKKVFNQRQGWVMEEDTLPSRFFSGGESPANGSGPGIDADAFRAAREAYYLRRGWDARGRPPESGGLLQALWLG
jgi:aldehyde:ferredoxin oxidoreductase